ncbi:MAG: hypothetical protein MI866_22320 [Bacteroidales bacterium]|nr:hypothetical protein [Bacteroidales bacterium]
MIELLIVILIFLSFYAYACFEITRNSSIYKREKNSNWKYLICGRASVIENNKIVAKGRLWLTNETLMFTSDNGYCFYYDYLLDEIEDIELNRNIFGWPCGIKLIINSDNFEFNMPFPKDWVKEIHSAKSQLVTN